MRWNQLSSPKKWTLCALQGHTYPTKPLHTRSSTLASLCCGGFIARVDRIEQHDNGTSLTTMGYVLTPRGERILWEG